MHTSVIRAISADSQGRLAVTAGSDATARLWDIKTGRLVRTYNIPLGKSETEGSLYAIAISPDSKLLATGGTTCFEWEPKTNCVYIIDIASGAVNRRLAGLPNAINRLAFTRNGNFLAVGLASTGGVRLLDVASWRELGADSAYASFGVSGLAFTSDGKTLYAGGWDGKVRKYSIEDGVLKKVAESAPFEEGSSLNDLSLSLDGKRLAVIVTNKERKARPEVIDSENLTSLYRPVFEASKESSLGRISWSADGKLWAGGTLFGQGKTLLKIWSDSGREGALVMDLPAANDTITWLQPLADGRMLFSSAPPDWGVAAADGRSIERIVSRSSMNLAAASTVISSVDGKQVRLRFNGKDQKPFVFDVDNGIVADNTSLAPPLKKAPGIEWSNSANLREPKINDVSLYQGGERAIAYAIAPDAERLAVAGDYGFRMFNTLGKQLWFSRAFTNTWGVAVSSDNRWVIGTVLDGTVRWLRADNGKVLLHAYFHNDGKSWVIWTPSGYYATAPNAEDLIGWHVNRGKENAPDFFPASRFRNKFYRPDVVSKIIQTQDEAQAVKLADAEAGRKQDYRQVTDLLPPVVAVLTPSDGSAATAQEVRIKLNLRTSAGAPVTGLKVRVNGQTIDMPAERNLTVEAVGKGVEREITLTIPQQDCDILIFAENKNGVSAPATLRLEWKGTAKPKEAFEVKPKLYIVSIGVSKYDRQEYRLELAAKDATDFTNAMKAQKGTLYRDVEVKLLTDSAATRDEVVDALDWLRAQVTAKDVAMVFLAGHGINDPDGTYYYLPVNADVEKLKRTGVVYSEIKNTLTSLPGKAIFFVDSCHSGNIMGGRRAAGDSTAFVNELSSAENGVVVFSSSTGKQYSLENPSWGNGAFTKALVEGLGGKADMGKTGRITHKMLDFYVGERVKELTKGQQTPVSISPFGVADFPLAVIGK